MKAHDTTTALEAAAHTAHAAGRTSWLPFYGRWWWPSLAAVAREQPDAYPSVVAKLARILTSGTADAPSTNAEPMNP